jgi:DNA-directed RNA polymerase subunit omega
MLKPSYAELMDVLNKNSDSQEDITSRYTIVIAAAKRARQLIAGDTPMLDGYEEGKPVSKPVSTAVQELYENKIKIVPEGEGTVLVFPKKKDEKSENDAQESVKKDLEAIAGENESEDDAFTDDAFMDDETQEVINNAEDIEDTIDFDE